MPQRLHRLLLIVENPGRHSPTEQVIIPDGYGEIIFNLGAGYSWTRPAEKASSLIRRTHVVGEKTASVVVQLPPGLYQMGVKLKPAGISSLLHWPARELTNTLVDTADVADPSFHHLAEQLWQAADPAVQKQLLDQFFVAKLPLARPTDPVAGAAVGYLLRSRGNMRIEELKNRLGVSYKVIEKRVRQHTGVSPKEFARVIRFKNMYRELRSGANADKFCFLDYGFYDQSHFIREFRYFLHDAPGPYWHGQSRYADSILKMGIRRAEHPGPRR